MYNEHSIHENNIKTESDGFWEDYIVKDTPNVRITFYRADKQVGSIYIDSIKSFSEEINSEITYCEHCGELIIKCATFSPENIELLKKGATKYKIETEEIWKDVKSGKDHFLTGPIRYYKHMIMRYQLDANGDSTNWYLIFYNDKTDFSTKYETEDLSKINIR